jgi:hypothetical protein
MNKHQWVGVNLWSLTLEVGVGVETHVPVFIIVDQSSITFPTWDCRDRIVVGFTTTYVVSAHHH